MSVQKKDQCYLLLGEDVWSKEKFIIEIKNKFLHAGYEVMNYFEFKDKDIVVSKLVEISQTLPFFSQYKLIYIKDCGFFKAGKKEETEQFEKLLLSLPEHIVFLVDEKEADKRTKLYKLIKNDYQILNFDYPGETHVLHLLKEKASTYNIVIAENELLFFLRNMPEDLAYIMNEFEKLALYANNQKITKQTIEAVCVFSLESRIFELVKAVAHRNAQQAFKIYNTLIQSKESPIGILVLIARQYRLMLQIKYLLKNTTSDKVIASQLKLPYFVVKEMIEQVHLYSFKQLENILKECLVADKDIKRGRMNSIKRVEVFMMDCLNAS